MWRYLPNAIINGLKAKATNSAPTMRKRPDQRLSHRSLANGDIFKTFKQNVLTAGNIAIIRTKKLALLIVTR